MSNEKEKPNFSGKWILQYLSIYLVGCWTIIEASNFFTERFYVSPYWTDLLLVLVLTSAPAVIYFAYLSNYQTGALKKRKARMLISSNGLITLFIILYNFSGKDLGSMKENVSLIDENGNMETRQRVKTDFKNNVMILEPYNSLKSRYDKISAVTYGLHNMLGQYDGIITQHEPHDFDKKDLTSFEKVEMIKRQQSDYFIEVNQDSNRVTIKFLDKNLKEKFNYSSIETSLYSIIDSATNLVISEIGTTVIKPYDVIVPLNEMVSDNEEVLRLLSILEKEKALAIDSNSSMANFDNLVQGFFEEAKNSSLSRAAERALVLRNKLPENC